VTELDPQSLFDSFKKTFFKLSLQITKEMSQSEIAIIKNEIYDLTINRQLTSDEELLGPNVYNDSESMYQCSELDTMMDAFLTLELNKFFNISWVEFKSLTRFESERLMVRARLKREELLRGLKDLEDGVENASATTANAILGGMGDEFN